MAAVVAVGEAVGVGTTVAVIVAEGVLVGVAVDVLVAVGVAVEVDVAVGVGVCVEVAVGSGNKPVLTIVKLSSATPSRLMNRASSLSPSTSNTTDP